MSSPLGLLLPSGREYGTASIEIHLRSCKQKWEVEQSKKPKKERKPCPEAPKNFDDIATGKVDAKKLDSYNNEAFNDWNEKVLEPCPNCARTFLPDRLEVHLRSCKGPGGASKESKSPPPKKGKALEGGMSTLQPPKPGAIDSNAGALASPNRTFKKPKSVVCYIW